MSVALSEQVLPVNGIGLHVTQAGTGEPLLAIHRVSVDATFELHVIEELGASWHVMAPDLRGHGRSSRPDGFALRDHVQDMIGLLDALAIQRTAVVGASMGSYVAQALALAVPERIRKLILVAAKSNGASSSSARILAAHAEELRGLSREDLETANNAVRDFDFREDLPGLGVPTLVISGRYDIFNPPDEGAQIVGLLPRARLEVFEHSGHLLSWEEPEHYVEVIRSFLRS